MAGRKKRQADADGRGTVKLVFRMTRETAEKLGVICSMEHTTRHRLLAELVLERGRRWVVQDRGPKGGQDEAA